VAKVVRSVCCFIDFLAWVSRSHVGCDLCCVKVGAVLSLYEMFGYCWISRSIEGLVPHPKEVISKDATAVLFTGVFENFQCSILVIPKNQSYVLNSDHENLRTVSLPGH
jgi:hypothetical protein